MNADERKSAAQAIVAVPLFNDIMSELEAGEINAAVSADYTDHEKRQGHLAAVRAIRNLRSTIRSLAEGQPTERKKAPA